MPKPRVFIDKDSRAIRINSSVFNNITITEAHSFLKDFIGVIYDYHKYFPEEKIGNYIKESQDA